MMVGYTVSLFFRPSVYWHPDECGFHPVESLWYCSCCGGFPQSLKSGARNQCRAVLHTLWRGEDEDLLRLIAVPFEYALHEYPHQMCLDIWEILLMVLSWIYQIISTRSCQIVQLEEILSLCVHRCHSPIFWYLYCSDYEPAIVASMHCSAHFTHEAHQGFVPRNQQDKIWVKIADICAGQNTARIQCMFKRGLWLALCGRLVSITSFVYGTTHDDLH